ncbi:MAG: ParA family protein [Polyangiaceae bacterium]|nr:ParA family protein [Polyangiaceae bacterium]
MSTRTAEPSGRSGAEAVGASKVVAFYGFRGGSGRTTALTHVAAALAARGRTVVAVDLDLEAPGLGTVLRCGDSVEGKGSLALLRAAELADSPDDERLRIAPHLVAVGADLPPIRVIPAGRLGPQYYAQLDLLNPALWHVMDGPSPLRLLFERIRAELEPDFILADCRTGLAPLTATAVFHEADVVVACFSASRQSHDGARAFTRALEAAQRQRGGRPSALLVPTMFVETDGGLTRRDELVSALEAATAPATEAGVEDPLLSDEPAMIVAEGIPFRTSLSVSYVLAAGYVQVAGRAYEPLVAALDLATREDAAVTAPDLSRIDTQAVLRELDEGIRGLPFAEEVRPHQVVEWFLPPASLHAILAPSTYYVVGGKGSGKSWLYRRMLAGSPPLDPEQTFIRGHGPEGGGSRDEDFPPDELRELDRALRGGRDEWAPAFWRIRAAATLLRWAPAELSKRALTTVPPRERSQWEPLRQPQRALRVAVVNALRAQSSIPRSEQLLLAIDELLRASPRSRAVLAYDALDTGFGSSETDLHRRERFVGGLVSALEGLRGRLHAIGFKVMLREDVFSQFAMQNKSHLRPATIELLWRAVDVWKLALSVATRSGEYRRLVRSIDPSAAELAWPDDEARLTRLLEPLWGARMERGRKISPTTFVQRRTADGQDRLFPRTLVEMLRHAVAHERTRDQALADRVLSSAALQDGYRAASHLRLDDLRAEYTQVSPYLEALRGLNPTSTRNQLRAAMQNQLRAGSGPHRKAKGAPAGALHAGPGGWNKVVDRLVEIGVLREYKRATGEAGEPKYEVALLYRPALGVRLVGV